MKTVMTTQGRMTILAPVRRKLSIKLGTRIEVEVDEERQRIVLTPITREYVHRLRGKYRGKGLLKTLMADKSQGRGIRQRAHVDPLAGSSQESKQLDLVCECLAPTIRQPDLIASMYRN
jgi:bifunctional DNA-binding transcriptional regulator/antitoxin component of YhaV-PrlF toxin-antitoxin module